MTSQKELKSQFSVNHKEEDIKVKVENYLTEEHKKTLFKNKTTKKEIFKNQTKKNKVSINSIPSNINGAFKYSIHNSYVAEHDEEINKTLKRE